MPRIITLCAILGNIKKLFSKYKRIIAWNFNNRIDIIVIRCALAFDFTTGFAFVCDNKSRAVGGGRNWSHHSTARCRTVTRIFINVPRPQAIWAMVCIAIATNNCATMGAVKIFGCFCKCFHYRPNALRYICVNSSASSISSGSILRRRIIWRMYLGS